MRLQTSVQHHESLTPHSGTFKKLSQGAKSVELSMNEVCNT